tara:strand:- start:290 stop:646 length:357 start_codon:yes stop_codon:yes gene_type:complete
MKMDDTKWFSSKPKLGVDYIIVVDCGAGGLFKCDTEELALKTIGDALRNGCGYSLRSEEPKTSLEYALERISKTPNTAELRMSEMEAADPNPDDGLIEVGKLKDDTYEASDQEGDVND